METEPIIAWLSKTSFALSILPIVIYDTSLTLLFSILFVKFLVDSWVRILLVQLLISNKRLLTYLSRLIVADIFVYILLVYTLVFARSPFLFAVMMLFSHFTLPFLKKKELDLMGE